MVAPLLIELAQLMRSFAKEFIGTACAIVQLFRTRKFALACLDFRGRLYASQTS